MHYIVCDILEITNEHLHHKLAPLQEHSKSINEYPTNLIKCVCFLQIIIDLSAMVIDFEE